MGTNIDRFLIELDDGDYEVNFGKHEGEKLTDAMVDDGRYFLDFVLVEFPDSLCDVILDCADNFGIVLTFSTDDGPRGGDISENKGYWRY